MDVPLAQLVWLGSRLRTVWACNALRWTSGNSEHRRQTSRQRSSPPGPTGVSGPRSFWRSPPLPTDSASHHTPAQTQADVREDSSPLLVSFSLWQSFVPPFQGVSSCFFSQIQQESLSITYYLPLGYVDIPCVSTPGHTVCTRYAPHMKSLEIF